jgi:hypothetical protein
MVPTLLLAGLRLKRPEIIDLSRRLKTMSILEESSFYHLILEKGRKEGEEQGQIAEAQKLLFRLGRPRLGPISKKTRVAIEGIHDLARLERLFERMLNVSDWAELLAEPEWSSIELTGTDKLASESARMPATKPHAQRSRDSGRAGPLQLRHEIRVAGWISALLENGIYRRVVPASQGGWIEPKTGKDRAP